MTTIQIELPDAEDIELPYYGDGLLASDLVRILAKELNDRGGDFFVMVAIKDFTDARDVIEVAAKPDPDFEPLSGPANNAVVLMIR